MPLFEVVLLLDGVEVDVAKPFDFAAKLGDFLADFLPVNGCCPGSLRRTASRSI